MRWCMQGWLIWCGAWWICLSKLTDHLLHLYLHNPHQTSTLCKWAHPVQHSRTKIKLSNLAMLIKYESGFCRCIAYLRRMFSETALWESCNMRKFESRPHFFPTVQQPLICSIRHPPSAMFRCLSAPSANKWFLQSISPNQQYGRLKILSSSAEIQPLFHTVLCSKVCKIIHLSIHTSTNETA